MEKKKEAIKTEDTLDIKALYPSDEAFYEEIQAAEKLSSKIEAVKGHLLESSENLSFILTNMLELTQMIEKIIVYGRVPMDLQIEDKKAQENYNASQQALTIANQALSFFRPELLKGDPSIIEKYIEENETVKEYEAYLKEIMRLRSHQASLEEESLFAELGEIKESFATNARYIKNQELIYDPIVNEEGKEVELTTSNYIHYIKSSNRRVRKEAYESREKAYTHSLATLSNNYISYVRFSEIEAKRHHYKSALEENLFENHLDKKIYANLLQSGKEHYSVFQKGMKLRKKVLGVDVLEGYDLNVPLIEDIKKEYPYEEGKQILLDAFQIYGSEYVKKLDYMLNHRRIDVYPQKGKHSGWYSWSIQNWDPIIVANYDNKIYDLSAIAHEVGHSVNAMFRKENVLPQYNESTLFEAEIFSLTNEVILVKYLLSKETDRMTKLNLLQHLMDLFEGNFFYVIRGALFEEKVHQMILDGEVVTKEKLNEVYASYGKELAGDTISSLMPCAWAGISHFYTPYYYYSYAIGISSAFYLADKIWKREDGALQGYLEFMKRGMDHLPLENMECAGIHLENPNFFKDAIHVYEELLDEFERIYDEK